MVWCVSVGVHERACPAAAARRLRLANRRVGLALLQNKNKSNEAANIMPEMHAEKILRVM